MSNNEISDDLATRLQKARLREGMTILEMAEACGIPKSSLESYMRLTGAKRPGLDALVAIADGMDVSVDWLVGRSKVDKLHRLSRNDYALACFGSVVSVLREHASMKDDDGQLYDAAAKAMLEFAHTVEMMHNRDRNDGDQREDLARDIIKHAHALVEP